MANAKKEPVSKIVEIETGKFVIPNEFQEEALKRFNEEYGKRELENVRITGMQHVVGHCVRYTVEALALPATGVVVGAADKATVASTPVTTKTTGPAE